MEDNLRYPEWTNEDAQLNARLQVLLVTHRCEQCSTCGRLIDRGDFSWNSGSTPYGTPFCNIDIICQRCDSQVAHIPTWWPGEIDDFAELLFVLEREWEGTS